MRFFKEPSDTKKKLKVSSWFIHSEPNHYIIEKLKELLTEYWRHENECIDYFLFHYLYTYMIDNDEKVSNYFYNEMPQFSNMECHFLQSLLMRKYDACLIAEAKSYSNIHKITYKGIPSGDGNTVCEYLLKYREL